MIHGLAFYEADAGLQGVRHVMNFVGYDDHTTPENEGVISFSDFLIIIFLYVQVLIVTGWRN
ncbi:hypothetical protein GCM10020331_099120 [Ectobacillus funiculus]